MQRDVVSRAIALAATMAVCALPAAAQRPGSVELGALGRFTKFDESLTLKNRLGGGGRLGVFVLPNLAIEGAGAYTPTRTASETVKNTNLAARLVYNLPIAEPAALLIGAGYVHTRYNAAVDANDNGIGGLLGVRYWVADAVSLRAEGTVDYIPSPANLASDNINWGVQLGVSYMFGGRVSDRDRDGVPDRADACGDTPMGVTVDAAGCPIDTDRDGVADYLDACASTAQGATVDATGCVLDTDGDGVRDDLDRCPTTPRGEAVNAAGCPPDADNDGVPDVRDRCPNTAAGTAVNATGCPPDADGDGVMDSADRCPNTPAGAAVDAAGCPRDSDGDGVANGLDRCPTTAAGTRVDAAGCAILFEENAARMVLRGVNFETGSARLTDTAQMILDGVAETLVANADVRVEVGGHTDNTGSRPVNVRLSQARAEAVATYLVGRGVTAERLTARGFGPDQPIADNATRDGRAQNRRVELRRVTQ